MKEEKILEFLRTIPPGKVVSYKFLAKRYGVSPRFVGWVLKKNQYPEIYPCYKVVYADGRVGNYNRGVEEKVKLLRQEGIEVKNNRIAKEYFLK